MKYIKPYKIFEDITSWSTTDKFEERDLTNNDTYFEIKNDFNISTEELGFILTEFIDEYNLLYKCRTDIISGKVIIVNFYPNGGDVNNLRGWMEPKIGHGQIWNWEMLSEMENRLNDYGLTIKEDDIYQIYLQTSALKIVIRKKSS